MQNIDFDSLVKMDLPHLLQFLRSLTPEQGKALFQQIKIDPNDERFQLKEGDPRLGFLYTLKSMLPPENAQIIDQIITTFKR